MFNDRDRALQELEDALLEEKVNEWVGEEALSTAEEEIYNSDISDPNLEEYSDKVANAPKKESLRGLVILAACLAGGILLVGLYWYLRFFKGIL